MTSRGRQGGQVVGVAAHVEEPAVGVRGWESLRATAGLNHPQLPDVVVAFHPVPAGLEPLDGCRVEVGGDGTDHVRVVGMVRDSSGSTPGVGKDGWVGGVSGWICRPLH